MQFDIFDIRDVFSKMLNIPLQKHVIPKSLIIFSVALMLEFIIISEILTILPQKNATIIDIINIPDHILDILFTSYTSYAKVC